MNHNPMCVVCENATHVRFRFIVPRANPCQYFLCRRCGLLFADPAFYPRERDYAFPDTTQDLSDQDVARLTRFFGGSIDISDKAGDLYFECQYDQVMFVEGIFDQVNGAMMKHAPATVADGFRLLEIGCGNGFLLAQVAQHYPAAETLGVDPSAVSCRKARERYGVHVLCGTMNTVELDPKSFDIVIMVGNLQLHENPVSTLRRIKEILKDDGLLIFDVKNSKTFMRQLATVVARIPALRSQRWARRMIAASYIGVRHVFSKEALRTVLAKLGYRVLSMETKPLRLVGFPNQSGWAKGLRGAGLRILDAADRPRDERAWIDVCCKPENRPA